MKVYADRTGEYKEPLSIGGGTYARAFPNAVAFGSEQPGISGPVHMPNEFIGIDELMFNAHMIAGCNNRACLRGIKQSVLSALAE